MRRMARRRLRVGTPTAMGQHMHPPDDKGFEAYGSSVRNRPRASSTYAGPLPSGRETDPTLANSETKQAQERRRRPSPRRHERGEKSPR